MTFYAFFMQMNYSSICDKLEMFLQKRKKVNYKNHSIENQFQVINYPVLCETDEKRVSDLSDENTNSNFIKLKKFKLKKLLNIEIQWVVHSFFVIYILSLWDIADVYHQYNGNDYNTASLFSSKNPTNLLDNFSKSIVLNEQILADDNIKSNSENIKLSKSKQLVDEYYILLETRYKNQNHLIERKNDVSLRINRHEKTYSQQVISNNNLKIVVLFKSDSKTFGDILFVCFSILILLKLDNIEKCMVFFWTKNGKHNNIPFTNTFI